MQKKPGLMKNTIILGVTSFLSKGVSFFLMPLYTACLSPAEFGVADILISTAVLLLPLLSLNAPEAVFRFIAGGEKRGEVLGAGLVSLLPGAALLLLLLPLFSGFSVFSDHLFLFFCYLVCAGAHSFAAHLVRAGGDYFLYSVQQLFCTLLTVFLELLFLPILSWGIRGYLSAILLADAVCALGLALILARRGELRPAKFPRALLFSMWRYALPLIPTAGLWWVIALSDRYVLLHYHGQAATGIYAAAGKIPALLTFAAGIFLEVWRYASLRVGKNSCAAFFGKIYGWFLPTVFALTGLLITFGGSVVSFLFSASFSGAAALIPVLSLASFFSVLCSFLGSVYALRLSTWRSLLTALVGALVNLLLNFLLIPALSGQGAALATLTSWLLVFLLRSIDCGRILSFPRHLGKTALSFLLCSLAAVSAVAERALPTLFFSVVALVPFWREIADFCRIFWEFCQKILKKPEKSPKSS